MTVLDFTKIRPGDEVLIRAEFVRSAFDGPMVRVRVPKEGAGEGTVLATEIVSHTPKALSVGDVVWGLATKRNGTVRAIYQGLAWVEFEDGRHEVCFPDQVERAQ